MSLIAIVAAYSFCAGLVTCLLVESSIEEGALKVSTMGQCVVWIACLVGGAVWPVVVLTSAAYAIAEKIKQKKKNTQW